MDRSPLPSGRYLSITIDVHPDYGGQTRALLMRNRILAAQGTKADVLFVAATPETAWRREVLRERGLLSPELELRNIYEDYRDTDWPGESPTDQELKNFDSRLAKETTMPDGSPWRRTYKLADGRTIHDYQRPDGTTFLRIPAFVFKDPTTWPTNIAKVARSGQVVGRYRSPAGWYRRWLRDLAGEERSFVFLDSRYLVPLVAPMNSPNIHLAYLMHNIHVSGDRRWDRDSGPVYERAIDLVDDLDAFVNLTERQSEDIAQRRGRTSNMFVVPNPVDLPPEPAVVERDPRLVSVVARIEGQKRLSHAVRAFQHVVAAVPDARLAIYGRGSRVDSTQRLINELDLSSSVTMMGHDPRAREALWRSSAFLMTSMFEGYPLSTLESMSHGCPVVSYDIKYGPREQISDGQDGFLVPEGDYEALAARVIEMLQDPELVRRMSAAARAKATTHGYDAFVSDWARVLNAAIANKSRRTKIERVDLAVRRLTLGRRHGGPRRAGDRERLRFLATLDVVGHGDLATAEVSLDAVHEDSGLVIDLPVSVKRRKDTLRVSSSAPLSSLYPPEAQARDRCRLRLRLTWENSSWQAWVSRPENGSTGLEAGFGLEDEWILTRR